MRMILKRKNKKHNILLLILLILTSVIILSLIFINYYSNKAYPILKSYAESETKKLTVLIINKAVTKQLYNIDVEELFKITYNKDSMYYFYLNNGNNYLIDYSMVCLLNFLYVRYCMNSYL